MALPVLEQRNFTMPKGIVGWCPGLVKPTTNGTVGYRRLGNCPGCAGNIGLEKSEMYSSEEGGNVLLDEAIKAKNLEMTVTTNDFSVKNLEMFAMGGEGNTVEQAQTAQTAQDVTINSVVQDLYFPLGFYKLTTVVVKDDNEGSPGSTTYVENVDYEILRTYGMIRVLSTGAIAAASKIHVLVDAPAMTSYKIKGFKADSQRGHLSFLGQPSKGAAFKFEAYGEMTPDGELAMVGEDYGQMQFKFKAYLHNSYDKLFHLEYIDKV